ncbi:MAG: hypothetical protein HC925_08380 [Coleofasciculaceae cyanobacterium SM2_3_26]|nr:hypothetical protein [Coleofasciculaceae cyanobacterium SM2_3_26]
MSDLRLIEFPVGEGQTVLVEAREFETRSGDTPVSKRRGIDVREARQTLEEALESLRPVVSVVKSKLDALVEPADEVEVKFGVKLSGEVGAVVTTLGGEVNWEITLRWKKPETP